MNEWGELSWMIHCHSRFNWKCLLLSKLFCGQARLFLSTGRKSNTFSISLGDLLCNEIEHSIVQANYVIFQNGLTTQTVEPLAPLSNLFFLYMHNHIWTALQTKGGRARSEIEPLSLPNQTCKPVRKRLDAIPLFWPKGVGGKREEEGKEKGEHPPRNEMMIQRNLCGQIGRNREWMTCGDAARRIYTWVKGMWREGSKWARKLSTFLSLFLSKPKQRTTLLPFHTLFGST